MGQILIAPTPKLAQPAASIFDPANNPNLGGVKITQFPHLRFVGGANGINVGGRFSLPPEFDSVRFASAYKMKGNEVLAAQREEPVLGTGYVADGWTVWKYPKNTQVPKLDDDGEPVMRKIPNKDWNKNSDPSVPKEFTEMVYEENPSSGQPHEVHSQEQNGPTYVLMCRPIEVQNQINEIYGLLSIDNMTAEVRGDTIGGAKPDDPGMLTDPRLANTHVDSDIAADRAAEEHLGRSSVVQSTLQSNQSSRLTKPPRKLSR